MVWPPINDTDDPLSNKIPTLVPFRDPMKDMSFKNPVSLFSLALCSVFTCLKFGDWGLLYVSSGCLHLDSWL